MILAAAAIHHGGGPTPNEWTAIIITACMAAVFALLMGWAFWETRDRPRPRSPQLWEVPPEDDRFLLM